MMRMYARMYAAPDIFLKTLMQMATLGLVYGKHSEVFDW